MTVEVLAPHDVQTTINFFKPTNDETPYNYVKTPEGIPSTNIGSDVQHVVVHDIRGKEDTVGLDKTGFQFVTYKSVEKDFVDEEVIKTKYYAEVEDILKKYAGAKRVAIFHHTIKWSLVDGVIPAKGVRGPVVTTCPCRPNLRRCPAIDRVYRYLSDDAERLLKVVFASSMPIANPIANLPLAVADYRTINPEKDLVSARIITPDREATYITVRYNPTQRWYFLANQTPDEVTLIKCYDSDEDKARLSPHSAFNCDVTSLEDAPNRHSIEVGALVFDIE
ncbi:hypothetical protein EDB19DRAFT_1671151 [Suillus lakei]|nr:hypothetical protein EDB19DRAFT_1671151 [Suillus lakei]